MPQYDCNRIFYCTDGEALGGSALALLGVVTRATDDCGVLDPEIPADIAAAAKDFAAVSGIDAEWLNSRAVAPNGGRRFQ